MQNWIQHKFHFLKSHIRHKGLSKSSGLKSPACRASASAASAYNIFKASTDMDSMEISMQSDTSIQPSVTSPRSVSRHSPVNQQVMDQFALMSTMLPSFLRPMEETTRTAVCNYLASEVVGLEDKDFQTFRNEAVKLLSSIQSRTAARGHLPQQTEQ